MHFQSFTRLKANSTPFQRKLHNNAIFIFFEMDHDIITSACQTIISTTMYSKIYFVDPIHLPSFLLCYISFIKSFQLFFLNFPRIFTLIICDFLYTQNSKALINIFLKIQHVQLAWLRCTHLHNTF